MSISMACYESLNSDTTKARTKATLHPYTYQYCLHSILYPCTQYVRRKLQDIAISGGSENEIFLFFRI
jgi:hypothetical protein